MWWLLQVGALQFFYDDVTHWFSECTMIDTSPTQPKQRGLGPTFLLKCFSCKHLAVSIKDLNELVSSDDAIELGHLDAVMHQNSLPGKIEDHHLIRTVLDKVSLCDKAILLSISSPHAVAWLSAIPSLRLTLHLESAEL